MYGVSCLPAHIISITPLFCRFYHVILCKTGQNGLNQHTRSRFWDRTAPPNLLFRKAAHKILRYWLSYAFRGNQGAAVAFSVPAPLPSKGGFPTGHGWCKASPMENPKEAGHTERPLRDPFPRPLVILLRLRVAHGLRRDLREHWQKNKVVHDRRRAGTWEQPEKVNCQGSCRLAFPVATNRNLGTAPRFLWNA